MERMNYFSNIEQRPEKGITLGTSDFKKLIDENGFYVDKTMAIKELIDNKSEVVLFTRPRRFGKTLFQSMVKTYFEKEIDLNGSVVDNSKYFEDLDILKCGDVYKSELGKYPVIFISFKGVTASSYISAINSLTHIISREFRRHSYVLSKLSERNRKKFEHYAYDAVNEDELEDSIQDLVDMLYLYHQERVMVLIDEYDVPLDNSFNKGFYEDMVGFMKILFLNALKDNPYLKKGVLTGCLRVSKESIFTGLNHIDIYSVTSNRFNQYFGFTQDEVDGILEYYHLTNYTDKIKKWYDGYSFGDVNIYNPWSIMSCINTEKDGIILLKDFWSGTSSNSLIKNVINRSNDYYFDCISSLMNGDALDFKLNEDLVYSEVYDNIDNLWSLFLYSGYLTLDDYDYNVDKYVTTKIPNYEVELIYKNSIMEWVKSKYTTVDIKSFFDSIIAGDTIAIGEFLNNLMGSSLSYFDFKEDFYHGLMFGLLRLQNTYKVSSNKESGLGRYDIVLSGRKTKDVYILEFKNSKNMQTAVTDADNAMKQICEKKYYQNFLDDGYKVSKLYGIAFADKECVVKMADFSQ